MIDKNIRGILIYLLLYILLNIIIILVSNYTNTIELFIGYINILGISISLLIIFLIQQFLVISFLFLSFYSIKKIKFIELFKYIIDYFKKQLIWLGYKKMFLYTFGMYFIYILISGFLYQILQYYNINIPGFFGEQEVANFIGNVPTNKIYDYIILFFIVVIIGPIIEEIVYRGFITKKLIEKYNSFIGVILGSFIFAFIHFEWSVLGNLFLLSLIIGYIYYKTNSLIYVILFHILVNGISLFALFFFKEIIENYSLIF